MKPDQLSRKAAPEGGKHLARGLETTYTLAVSAFLSLLWFIMRLLHADGADNAIYVATRNDSSALAHVAEAFTQLGGGRSLWVAVIAGALLLLWRRQVWSAALLIVLTIAGIMLDHYIKVSIGLPRPDRALWLTHASNPTFPSGHAANSMIVYLSIALLLTRMAANHRWLVAAALILCVLVGISRVVLGVHWPSDVVAGWSFGAAWALVWCSAAVKLENLTGSERNETARLAP